MRIPQFEPSVLDLRYRVFLNIEATIPVATFIIQAYAEEFAAAKFTHVDLWVVRDLKKDGAIVARNTSVPPPAPGLPTLNNIIKPGKPGAQMPRRRSSD